MKKGKVNILLLLIIWVVCLAITGCKERFEPDLPSVNTGYLVVEGVINSGGGATQIKLTRSRSISSQDRTVSPELRALVQVESEHNAIFPLPEKGQGLYSAENLNLESSIKYRLRIKTANGKEYLSEFTAAKKTPVIDDVTWEESSNGVQLYVNTQDATSNSRYYKWEYEETWEYLSPEYTELKWENGKVVPRLPTEQGFRCWGQAASNNLLLGSSAQLSQDIIYQQPLVFIPPASVKLSHKYSILVKQYALTREAYDFLQTMKKNTETMGSFFDPQPSELKGNIQCLSNPNEPVIGFVSICNVIEKRIYIERRELDQWQDIHFDCKLRLVPNQPDSMKWYFAGIPPNPYPRFKNSETGFFENQTKPCCNYIPLQYRDGFWYSALDFCVDCTKRGGNTVKPDFWP